MIKKLLIMFLLLSVASAYQLPSTYVNGGLNVKNTSALNVTTATTLAVSGTTDLNGATTAANITLDANKSIVLSGTGRISGAASVSATALAGELTGNVTGTGTLQGEQITSTDDITAGGIIRGEHLTSTDDATVYDTLTTDHIWVNESSDFLGEIEASVAIDRTPYEIDVNTSISDSNIPGLYFVGNASVNQSIELPTAAAGDGTTLTFVVATDPGSFYFILEGAGSEKINGAANKMSTALYDVIEVTSNGTAWFVTDSVGTWA